MKKKLFLSAMLLAAIAVQAKDIRKVAFTTIPQMHCADCENKIKNNMRFEKGVKMIDTNIEKQTVVIRFDADKTTVEKLIKGFEKIGYKAREVKEETPRPVPPATDATGCHAL